MTPRLHSHVPSRMRRRWLASASVLFATISFGMAAPARADVVTIWNEIADTISTFAGAPPFRARIVAMVQLAVHDALNSIEPRYASYIDVGRARAGASPSAAVATATYIVLSQTVPSQASAVLTRLGQPRAVRHPLRRAVPRRPVGDLQPDRRGVHA